MRGVSENCTGDMQGQGGSCCSPDFPASPNTFYHQGSEKTDASTPPEPDEPGFVPTYLQSLRILADRFGLAGRSGARRVEAKLKFFMVGSQKSQLQMSSHKQTLDHKPSTLQPLTCGLGSS